MFKNDNNNPTLIHQEGIVCILPNMEELESTIDSLSIIGFDQSQFSMMASRKEIKDKLGIDYKNVEEVTDNPLTPTHSYVSTESLGAGLGGIISGIIYALTILGCFIMITKQLNFVHVITISSLIAVLSLVIGVIIANIIYKKHEDYILEQINHGGLVLRIDTRSKELFNKASQFLIYHKIKHHLIKGFSS